MFLLKSYPPLALVINAFKSRGARVFLVGGALRDYFLNRQGTDLDFAVDKNAIFLSRQFAKQIKGAFVLLDGEHGSARVVKKIDGVIWTFDFTDWRGKTIQQDLALRDFTINAFALDILDPKASERSVLGMKNSIKDLKARAIRMVNSKVFNEDPLRLLRAYSLQSTLGFKIEIKTLDQIKKDTHLIPKVAVERIREEFFKILSSKRAYENVLRMDKIGLLPRIMPQITVMYKVQQGGYHHLDVWRHSLEVLKQLEKNMTVLETNERIDQYLKECIGGNHQRFALLKMAALLHDIGKPETRRQEKTRMTFHGHEHAGEGITRQVAKQLKLTVKERYFLEDAVRMHLRPGYLSNFKRPSQKAVFRYLRDTQDEAVSLAILALADQAATRGSLTTDDKNKHHAKICHLIMAKYFEIKDQKPKERLLTGDDLIKTLKLKPSALFGKILGQIEEWQALGKISSKSEALSVARQISDQQ